MTEELAKGVEVDEVQVWRDPEDGTIIFQVARPVTQVTISAAKWEKLKAFIDGPAIET